MLFRVLVFGCFFGLCIATSIVLGVYPVFLSFVAAALLTKLSERAWNLHLFQKDRRRVAVMGLYSLLFGQAVGIGRLVVFMGIRCNMHQNRLDIDTWGILTGILISILVFPILLNASEFACRINLLPSPRNLSVRKVFAISWAAIAVCWLPYLLAYSPGGIVGDGAHTLEEALRGGAPSTNHWSVCYILVLRFFLWLGSMVSARLQAGVYLWVWFASLAIAAVFALVAATLWKRGAPRWAVVSIVAMYALCGFFASYGMSLWKDGTFGAAIVLLCLMLWRFTDDDKAVSAGDVAGFAALGFFLCVWRSNGPFLLAPTLVGIAILMRKRGKALVVSGILVIVISAILTGPIYRACGIGSDSLRESISIPTQQLAAVINHDRPLTAAQKEVLFDILPEKTWRRYYSPGDSDDLKVRMDNTKISSQVPGMLKVWAQLLPSNLKLYVEAYLLQTIGFWKPFCWRGIYRDYWVGIQDISCRGFYNDDKFIETVGYDIKPLLEMNMRLVSSGTMVWLLLLACAVILSRRTQRAKRLLPLLPLVAGWAMIMVSTPLAFFHRYVVFITLALPLILALPLGPDRVVSDDGVPSRNGFAHGSRILLAVLFGALSLAALCAVMCHIGVKDANLRDDPFDIWFYGKAYNAGHYIKEGSAWQEVDCSWTIGNVMTIEVPVKSSYRDFDVKMSVLVPFHGPKHWVARQGETILGSGAMNAAGDIVFRASATGRKLAFSIDFPDAERPCDVSPSSTDPRLISMRVRKIRIGPHR